MAVEVSKSFACVGPTKLTHTHTHSLSLWHHRVVVVVVVNGVGGGGATIARLPKPRRTS